MWTRTRRCRVGSLWQCDWCGAIWDTRDAVALLDIEFGGEIDRKIHACPDHLPNDWSPPPEGIPDIGPVMTAEEWEGFVADE